MPSSRPEPYYHAHPTPPLGRTGQPVTIFGLGGEGIRNAGQGAEAVAVIERAIQQGVNYFETAPPTPAAWTITAWPWVSIDRKSSWRRRPTIAATTVSRLLDDSLRRLRTDYLDSWQLHDLRSEDDLSRIFGKGGAMKALLQARPRAASAIWASPGTTTRRSC